MVRLRDVVAAVAVTATLASFGLHAEAAGTPDFPVTDPEFSAVVHDQLHASETMRVYQRTRTAVRFDTPADQPQSVILQVQTAQHGYYVCDQYAFDLAAGTCTTTPDLMCEYTKARPQVAAGSEFLGTSTKWGVEADEWMLKGCPDTTWRWWIAQGHIGVAFSEHASSRDQIISTFTDWTTGPLPDAVFDLDALQKQFGLVCQ